MYFYYKNLLSFLSYFSATTIDYDYSFDILVKIGVTIGQVYIIMSYSSYKALILQITYCILFI